MSFHIESHLGSTDATIDQTYLRYLNMVDEHNATSGFRNASCIECCDFDRFIDHYEAMLLSILEGEIDDDAEIANIVISPDFVGSGGATEHLQYTDDALTAATCAMSFDSFYGYPFMLPELPLEWVQTNETGTSQEAWHTEYGVFMLDIGTRH